MQFNQMTKSRGDLHSVIHDDCIYGEAPKNNIMIMIMKPYMFKSEGPLLKTLKAVAFPALAAYIAAVLPLASLASTSESLLLVVLALLYAVVSTRSSSDASPNSHAAINSVLPLTMFASVDDAGDIATAAMMVIVTVIVI